MISTHAFEHCVFFGVQEGSHAPKCASLPLLWAVACLIAVFKNMRTLKFKAQLTIGFFTAVNHNYGNSQRTLKPRNKQNGSKSTNHDRKTWPFDPAEVSFCFPRGPLRWLTAAKNVNRWLRFEFQSSHVIENSNKALKGKLEYNWIFIKPWSLDSVV